MSFLTLLCIKNHERSFDCRVIERPGLESRRSRKRLFFQWKIANSLNLNLIFIIAIKEFENVYEDILRYRLVSFISLKENPV